MATTDEDYNTIQCERQTWTNLTFAIRDVAPLKNYYRNRKTKEYDFTMNFIAIS